MSKAGARTRRPIVGILAGRAPSERYSLHEGYVNAVAAVGALPFVLPAGPLEALDRICEQILICDGLIVSGGGDVHPELSRLADHTEAHDVDRNRDDVEIAAIHTALASGRPVLGICRGMQVLAVAFGGSLVGDLQARGHEGHDDVAHEYEPVHAIEPEPGSEVRRLLGPLRMVNSTHHQAVLEPGRNQRATAWSPDGVIEALEAPGALGVQWHPERLFSLDDRHLAVFRWLLA